MRQRLDESLLRELLSRVHGPRDPAGRAAGFQRRRCDVERAGHRDRRVRSRGRGRAAARATGRRADSRLPGRPRNLRRALHRRRRDIRSSGRDRAARAREPAAPARPAAADRGGRCLRPSVRCLGRLRASPGLRRRHDRAHVVDERQHLDASETRSRHGLRQLRSGDRGRSDHARAHFDRDVHPQCDGLQRGDLLRRRRGHSLARRRRDLDEAAAARRGLATLCMARERGRAVPRRLHRRDLRGRPSRPGLRARVASARGSASARVHDGRFDPVTYGVRMSFLLRLAIAWAINAAALWVADALWDGVRIDGTAAFLIGSAVLGIANTFIKPLVALVTLPLIIVTLGFFYLLINIAMVALAEWFAPNFSIDGFWAYVGTVLVVWAVNWIADEVPDTAGVRGTTPRWGARRS